MPEKSLTGLVERYENAYEGGVVNEAGGRRGGWGPASGKVLNGGYEGGEGVAFRVEEGEDGDTIAAGHYQDNYRNSNAEGVEDQGMWKRALQTTCSLSAVVRSEDTVVNTMSAFGMLKDGEKRVKNLLDVEC